VVVPILASKVTSLAEARGAGRFGASPNKGDGGIRKPGAPKLACEKRFRILVPILGTCKKFLVIVGKCLAAVKILCQSEDGI